MGKKDLQKSRKDLNLKEVTIGQICLFLCLNSIKVGQWFSPSEEERYAKLVKDQETREESFINVKLVKVQVKWKELFKFKENPNRYKWNATNAKDQEKLQKVSAQFAEVKKFN